MLLSDSHRTLTTVKEFAPAVANGRLDNGTAVAEINLIISARQRQLDSALHLVAPDQIGAQATPAKRQFMAAYAPLRRTVTGKTAASLPNGY